MPLGKILLLVRSVSFVPMFGLLGLAAGASLPADSVRAADDLVYQPYGNWNGYRIYLSPARHTNSGSRGECGDKGENKLAYYAAWDAANTTYWKDRYNPDAPNRNLRARGYKVRIGRGTVSTAITRSNGWPADRHIVLHSNYLAGFTCGNNDAFRFGTHVIYRNGSVKGERLATQLKSALGEYDGLKSPGTNDIICYNPGHPCTKIDLGELRETKAPAAYSETEFHSWNRGYNYLLDSFKWAWRVGRAVDIHLGYP